MGKDRRKVQIYEMQAEICAALAHPIRLQILDLLSERQWTATELGEELGVSKANLSQHLSILKERGLIRSDRKGLFQQLSLGIPEIKDACSLVRSVLITRLSESERESVELKKELRGWNR